MLPNIRNHSIIVAQVAEHLVNELNDCKNKELVLPERRLTIAGALLHDIAKTPCLNDSCDHAAIGGDICERHGYEEIAAIVRQHVVLRDHDPDRFRSGHFTARDIVYYADKRVMHEGVVSLSDRLSYIITHYGNNDSLMHERIRKNFNKCVQLEKFLFTFLPFQPNILCQRMQNSKLSPSMLTNTAA